MTREPTLSRAGKLIITAVLTTAALTSGATAVQGAPEDSKLFNCYVSGNAHCGSDRGILGFSNLR